MLLVLLQCCKAAKKEKAFYTVPHSDSSYSGSINNAEYINDKQLIGTYNVIEAGTRPSSKNGSLSTVGSHPRSSTGASSGHLYYDESDSPLPVKKRGGSYQADNVMEEIQLSDLYIYDHNKKSSQGALQSPELLDDSNDYAVRI